MERQVYKINIAPRLPAASLGLSGSSRQQNLTAFGLSEDFFGGGRREQTGADLRLDVTISFTGILNCWRSVCYNFSSSC